MSRIAQFVFRSGADNRREENTSKWIRGECKQWRDESSIDFFVHLDIMLGIRCDVKFVSFEGFDRRKPTLRRRGVTDFSSILFSQSIVEKISLV